ncbi:MAG: Trk system potassium transporter TrkA [Clostridia bacterium]|nr:Trk system potassium transporter TrkA [Clostridia bacterium]
MNILVVGCGKIGGTIVASLVAEGHNVVAIDENPVPLNELGNVYDIMSVCGNGADSDVLEEAGVAKADLFVAVTGSDNTNMLSCFLAKRMGVAHTIARIRNPEYNDNSLNFLKQELGLSMSINPELLAAQEMYKILKLPSAVKVETFSRRRFEMIELHLKEDTPLDGLRLCDLRGKYKAKFLICVVQRGDEVYIPDGNFVLRAGDKIGLTAQQTEIHKLLREMGLLTKQARNVMILGGSRVAYYLAKLLLSGGSAVTIIERDQALCQELCNTLPKAVVVHGDGAQQEILLEEDLLSRDAFVALTGMDEENILISIFASSQNVPKVIAKVNREELSLLAEKLGMDCIVSPKKVITDVLVRYARALQNSMGSNIETLYHLMDGKAEALEFNVSPDFPMLGVALKEMKLKPNTLIAGIIRDRATIIPGGNDKIFVGDRVVVVAADRRLQDLSDILK